MNGRNHAILGGLILLGSLAACGPPAVSPGSDARPEDAAPPPDGQIPDASSADGAAPVPYCRSRCTSPMDCSSGGLLDDADNNACVEGSCQWLGCRSTEECVNFYLDSRLVCTQLPGMAVPDCLRRCESRTDCDHGRVLGRPENFACEEGLCVWLGCMSDSECAEAYFDPSWGCVPSPTPGISDCRLRCTVVADCVRYELPAIDEDNFRCTDGLCEYLGCHSTEECDQTLQGGPYVCQ